MLASDFENFKAWFSDTLEKLYPDRDCGFAILMIVFPLLERYIRHKNGLGHKDNLTNACMDELRKIFPVLPTIDAASQFWNVFRNGILHQVTLSRENRSGILMPEGWLSHDIDSAMTIESDRSFLVHPVHFSKRVICIIKSDFATFEKGSSVSTKLPKVKPHPTATNGGKIVLGTNTKM